MVTTAPQANAITWTIDPASRATVRVREQLVRLPAPNDAVITITGAQGSFTLNADGTFAAGSRISVDMTTVMRPPSSFSVLSIVDEIRMEFALVANEARA